MDVDVDEDECVDKDERVDDDECADDDKCVDIEEQEQHRQTKQKPERLKYYDNKKRQFTKR